MFESIWLDAAAVIGFFHVAAPIAARSSFRFSAKCDPKQLTAQDLPQQVAFRFLSLTPKLQDLGFELIGCYDCGELSSHTRTYIAYFFNRRTNDFANISVVASQQASTGYFEFSTRFTDGSGIETNTNRVLPLTPGNPQVRIFRLPEIQEPEALYNLHRGFIEKYADGLVPQAEPQGLEISRMMRVLRNYGPRHAAIGYMQLSADEKSYRLTWKGACLMAWRALWPTALLRHAHQKLAMREEVRSLEGNDEAILQKA